MMLLKFPSIIIFITLNSFVLSKGIAQESDIFKVVFAHNHKVSDLSKNAQIQLTPQTYICLAHDNGGMIEIYGDNVKYSIQELEKKLLEIQKQKKHNNINYVIGKPFEIPENHPKNYKEVNRCISKPILIHLPPESYLIDNQLNISWVNHQDKIYAGEFQVDIAMLDGESLLSQTTDKNHASFDLSKLADTEEDMLMIKIKTLDADFPDDGCSPHTFLLPVSSEVLEDYKALKTRLDLKKLKHRFEEIDFLIINECVAHANDRWMKILNDYSGNQGLKIKYHDFLIQNAILSPFELTNLHRCH